MKSNLKHYRSTTGARLPMLLLGVPIALSFSPGIARADETPTPAVVETDYVIGPRIYRSNAERREAGGTHALTPWLDVSTLVELEASSEDRELSSGARNDRQGDQNATLQVGLDITLASDIKAELVLEADTVTRDLHTDEALLVWEIDDDLELELGRGYTPFGEYFNHFVTGPALEFGETQADIIALDYAPEDQISYSLTMYQGHGRKARGSANAVSERTDLAFAVKAWPGDTLSTGFGYQTDLTDSDAHLLEDNDDRYSERVSGVSGFLVWSADEIEISVEILAATQAFDELEPDRNRPRAWNLEFVHIAGPRFEWALRLEGSHELEDAPETQYGAAITWRLHQQAGITLEYLHAEFQRGLVLDNDDQPYGESDSVGALVTWVF